MDVYKILVVGEPQTGKSTLITAIFDCGKLNDAMSLPTTFTKQVASDKPQQSMDFVLKIVNVNGRKARVQLWDMAGSVDTASVFSPLFVRNAVACIVVGRSDKPLDEMAKWKAAFDEKTQVPLKEPLPTAFFINHGHAAYETGKGATIDLNARLDQACRDIRGRAQPTDIYHVNAQSGDGIYESFTHFTAKIIEDQENNRRNEEMEADLWDQSIVLKTTQQKRPTSTKPSLQAGREGTKQEIGNARKSVPLNSKLHAGKSEVTAEKKKKCCSSQ